MVLNTNYYVRINKRSISKRVDYVMSQWGEMRTVVEGVRAGITSKGLQCDKYEEGSGKTRTGKTQRTSEERDGWRVFQKERMRSVQIRRGYNPLSVCPWVPNKPPARIGSVI